MEAEVDVCVGLLALLPMLDREQPTYAPRDGLDQIGGVFDIGAALEEDARLDGEEPTEEHARVLSHDGGGRGDGIREGVLAKVLGEEAEPAEDENDEARRSEPAD